LYGLGFTSDKATNQWDVTNRQLQSDAGSKYLTARRENAKVNHHESFAVLPADEAIAIT
jgi:hypothetical protein